jgi:hypothetical protein
MEQSRQVRRTSSYPWTFLPLHVIRKINPALGDSKKKELAVGLFGVLGHFEAVCGIEPVTSDVFSTHAHIPRYVI